MTNPLKIGAHPIVLISTCIVIVTMRQLMVFFQADFSHEIMTTVFFLIFLGGMALYFTYVLMDYLHWIINHPRTIKKEAIQHKSKNKDKNWYLPSH